MSVWVNPAVGVRSAVEVGELVRVLLGLGVDVCCCVAVAEIDIVCGGTGGYRRVHTALAVARLPQGGA